jgi:peptidyl-prolyl cis-trans isomerase B (cyclophilin B)
MKKRIAISCLAGLLTGLLFLTVSCKKEAPAQSEAARATSEAPAPKAEAAPKAAENAPAQAAEPSQANESAASAAQGKADEDAPKPGTEPVAFLRTKLGTIEIKFFPDKAPNTVKNFIHLCKTGFYDGTKFHRVIPGFMIQGGDPNTRMGPPSTWGQGGQTDKFGSEINIKAEFNDIHHARGIVSMARATDPDSASSQFFICVADAGYLDHKYTAFGKVIKGMDVVDKIVNAPRDPVNNRPKNPVAIDKAWVEYLPVKGLASDQK